MTKAWADKLPKSIRVGPYDYRIELWDNAAARASHRFGEFSSIEGCIRIQHDLANIPQLVDVVIHEACHALYSAYQIMDDDKEERIVSSLGTGWTQIFRDNPALVQWFSDASAEMRKPVEVA
jgi:hypothetical protein